MRHLLLLFCLLGLSAPHPAQADTMLAGGDLYVAGASEDAIPAAGRDLIATGFRLRVTAPVADDAMLSGAAVTVSQSVGGDLSAFGGRVAIEAEVGGDLSVSGFSVETGPAAAVAGNVRLSGGSVEIRGPVSGALVVAGGEVTLDAPVEGDVRLSSGALSFGEAARIGGQLTYSAPEPIDIPASVVPGERVTFNPFDARHDGVRGDRHPDWSMPGRGAMIGSALIGYVFFLVAGALFLTFVPDTVGSLDARIATRPALTFMIGLAGLGTAFGLVPILALSVIGIPLIPVMLMAIVLLWMAGYLMGVYAISMRMLSAMAGDSATPGTAMRTGALAAGLAVAMLLNFIPVLGWVLNFAALLLGVGAIVALPFDTPQEAEESGTS